MERYFDEFESINAKLDVNVKPILETIANRYIGQNPVNEPAFRVFNKGSFKRTSDYRYILDFNEKYPNAEYGSFSYAWAKMWSDSKVDLNLTVTCFSPVRVFCNGELGFKSSIVEETDYTIKKAFTIKLSMGWNSIIIKCKKVHSGFGCILGTSSFKGNPFHFLTPSLERDGQEGFIFTEPMKKDIEVLPLAGAAEASTNIKWYPEIEWKNEETHKCQFERIYGFKKNCFGFAWTKGNFNALESREYVFKGYSKGAVTIYLDGKEIYYSANAAEFNEKVEVSYGKKDILIKCESGPEGWGFKLDILSNNEKINLNTPFLIKGVKDPFVYAGTFDEKSNISIEDIRSNYRLFNGIDGEVFWQVDIPDSHVRVYHESNLFGKWNYPLGVTLYGLLQSGNLLENNIIMNYVKQHIELCTSYYKYSLWDRREYGAAGINSQISGVDSLDDCGSFGATMLESMQYFNLIGAKEVADDIANYITYEQARLEDGALYRRNTYIPFMEETMWADDLYMSIPFLCKYYRLTGEKSYVNDAAKQILLFKKYLYMPDSKIMSHVYNFRCGAATGIPWGRGNGWVLFSLSELLAFLPEKHEDRNELISFFNELCEGYLKLQDENGMWHQVLTDHGSYPETSCTSMFTYGFARGIRYGWIKDIKPYISSVFKAWEGLSKISIDKNGNIYGVCRGSGYSYSADYYKDDLSWLLNDTHGIGIVMLAGIEVYKLEEFFKTQS